MRVLFLSIILAALLSCQSKSTDGQKKSDSSMVESVDKQPATNSEAATSDDCPRSIPQPIILKDKYPNAQFVLKDRVGYESLRFDNGDSLMMKSQGCEYYSVSFSLTTTRLKADSLNFKSSCEQFVEILDEIKGVIDSPLDLEQAIVSIRDFEKNKDGSGFNSEIVIEEGDIRQFALVKRISKLDDNISVFEIEISIGPL